MHVANSCPWFVICVLSLFLMGFAMQKIFIFMNLDLSLFSLMASGLRVILRLSAGTPVPWWRGGVRHCAKKERHLGTGCTPGLCPHHRWAVCSGERTTGLAAPSPAGPAIPRPSTSRYWQQH